MTTVTSLIDRAMRWFASRTAVVDGNRSLTFSEVGDRSTRVANVLLENGDTPSGRVAVLLGNRLEFVEADLGIARAGKVKVPINPRLSDDERRFILGNVGADILITEASQVERIASIRPDLPDLRMVISLGGGPESLDYEEAIADARPTGSTVMVDPTSPSVILHTSGTTGRPKGAVLSDRARVAGTISMLADEYAIDRDDGMVHVGPLSHGSGSKILAYLARGARQILLPRYEPERLLDVVRNQAGTSTFMVPTMIRMLLDASDGGSTSGLRNVTYGGSPIDPGTLDEALDRFGPIFVQVYGSCEAPHPVTVLSKPDHMDGDGDNRRRSAGREATAVELRIVDDDGRDVEDGEPGELWVRGPNVMTEYWRDAEATADVFSDGWYRSGDVGQRDDGGYVYILDRKRDLIISGGLNVYPAEVEAVVARHPDVQEVGVFGVPDPLWGEVVTAFVVPRARRELTEEEVTDFCRAELASYKKPRHVRFVTELPKGSTGKILRSDLRARFLAEAQDDTA